ncbi:MAG: site-specific DNA-methyltransferase, partial [Actinobacteria bacterium]|nr:site-specific DNA-methyltransferase [Actinomycetota bacterium]
MSLVVTSPPFFALRSYRDAGEHYDGQLGSEPTPQAFLEALWAVMAECWRVLRPDGVCFVELGDKRAGSGGHNNSNVTSLRQNFGRTAPSGANDAWPAATRRNAPDRYNQAAFGRPKSKMLLPHRFAIGCMDGLADPEGKGWIVRQDQVLHTTNGLPESVTDRTRDSHRYWFMLTKQERYYSALDEIREVAQSPNRTATRQDGSMRHAAAMAAGEGLHHYDVRSFYALGKSPSSVWSLPSEPLDLRDYAVEDD